MRKELQKTKDIYNDLIKQNDALKKKYSEEVDHLKQFSEDDRNNKNEKIQELEQKLKMTEEQFEISKQKWEKDQAIYK